MRQVFHDNHNEEREGGGAAAANDNRRCSNAKFIIYAQGQPPFRKKAKHGFSVGYNDSTRVTVPKDNENV